MTAAESLALAVRGELAVVHVVDPRAAINVQADLATIDLLNILRKDGRRVIDDATKRFRGASGPATALLREGDPQHEILAAAREWNADLIVVGTHGRGGLTRVLLGSTAESLIRHATIPVLVVRGEATPR